MCRTPAGQTSTASKLLLIAFLGLLVTAAKTTQAQTETVLYRFCSQPNCTDGYYPSRSVVLDTTGNVYGTTRNGGTYQYGTLFEINPNGVETVRHNFMQGYGSYPEGTLMLDGKGNLYGATDGSGYVGLLGSRFFGSVFKLEPRSYRFLDRFSAAGSSEGAEPSPGLVMDAQGNVYGTAASGGANGCVTGYGCGAVFKLSPKGTETVLYNFAGGMDGENPNGSLIFDSAGNLYGTTLHGAINSPYCVAACGTVFKLTPGGTETVLYRFMGVTDGGNPDAGLVMDGQGNLYGTTLFGGSSKGNGWGTVFEITAAGEEILLYRFTGGLDGGQPTGGLILDEQGNLYGTAFYGGGTSCYENAGCGTVFKVSPQGVETVLYRFQGGTDGEAPYGGLARDAQGNFYGVTAFGGNYNVVCSQRGCGVAFKVTP